jgi:hypothetical protein
MEVERNASAEEPPAEKLPKGEPAASGFALVAKRISSWTTNCLFSALILVLGLAFGRQVLVWWGSDEAEPLASPPQLAMTDGLGDDRRPHLLQFGDSPWAVRRQTITGTRSEAAAALRAVCRESTVSSALPPETAGSEESRFLDSLDGRTPVDGKPGQWMLFEMEGGFPLAAGVRTRAAEDGLGDESPVADLPGRVVTWGIAVPTAERTWTLYTFCPDSGEGGPLAGLTDIELPPDSTKTISIQVAQGGAIVAFETPAKTSASMDFFDRQFRRRGWTAEGTWQSLGKSRHGRYVEASTGPARTVDVRLTTTDRGETAGLLFITPREFLPAKRARP